MKKAAGPLSGARVTRLIEDDAHVSTASALIEDDARAILGISINSASNRDEDVEIVFWGEVEDATFNFVPMRNVFVGSNGEPTQTFDPSWRYVRVIGLATAPNKMMVALRPPTFLAH